MNLALLIRKLTEKGMSAEDIAEIIELIEAPAGKPPKVRSAAKKRFVPEDWSPQPSHAEKAMALGFTDEQFADALTAFREWEFKDGKVNFDLAFHRWLRTNAGRSHGTAVSRDFAADRAASRVQAMVEGARIAASTGRRRWTL